MTIRPVASPPYAVFAATPPVTLPPVITPTDGPGPALSARTLERRYESLAENIAAAALAPNAEGNQHTTLTTLRQLGLLSQAECNDRQASLRSHCNLHGAPLHGTQRSGTGAANQLWKIVHPARLCWGAAWNRFTMTGYPGTYLRLLTEVRNHPSRPEFISFHTDDNVQLSGLLVRATGAPGKPMMLMASGNASCAEAEFPVALAHARTFDVDVLLYNPRGVGLSLGDTTHPAQALLDCTAAIRKAAEYSDRLCVWGCSLGGALTTRALRGLRDTHDAVLSKLQYTVCVNSFANLPSIMGQVITPRWLPSALGRGASTGTLAMMGIDPLDTHATLQHGGLGVPGLVCNSTADTMMHDTSSLAEALQESQVELPENLHILEVDAGGHNHYIDYLDQAAYVQAIAQWRGI